MSDFRVRASAWPELFDCSHRFEAKHILGMRSPSGPPTLLGTAIHAATAAFDQGRIDNAGLRPDDVAGIVVDTIENPPYEINWDGDDFRKRDAIKIGLQLTTMYCLEISPRYTFESVEMETKPLTVDVGGGDTVTLTGTLDRSRIVVSDAGKGISDIKTGRAAVEGGVAKTRAHGPQLGTYELLYEHTTGEQVTLPAEIIGLKTSGKPEIATGLIVGARDLMVGTDGQPGLIEYAIAKFRTGLFDPNPTSMLCSPKYCVRWQTCKFHH